MQPSGLESTDTCGRRIDVPVLILHNGCKMPVVGLGTSLKQRARKAGLVQEVVDAVEYALDIGYRSVDTAYSYNVEEEVGVAIRKKLDEKTITRDEIFVTTKLPNIFHSPKLVVDGLRKSLKRLQLDYVDLYLIHSPVGTKYIDDDTCFPKDCNGNRLLDPYNHIDIWREMERTVQLGLTRSIGLSNFNHVQIQNILAHARIKPVNLQVECHVYHMQHQLFNFCQQNGITFTCYAPLGSPGRFGLVEKAKAKPAVLEDAVVKKIAENHHKSPAQIVLRYLVDHGRAVIPKSFNKERLQQNLDLFTFELTTAETLELDQLNQKMRYFDEVFAQFKDSPDYPFDAPF